MTEPRQRDWPLFDLLPDWMDEAACANAPNDWWFPKHHEGGAFKAKRVCWNDCQVREECLDYAVTTQQKFGIWGGMSERERRRVRKERAA